MARRAVVGDENFCEVTGGWWRNSTTDWPLPWKRTSLDVWRLQQSFAVGMLGTGHFGLNTEILYHHNC